MPNTSPNRRAHEGKYRSRGAIKTFYARSAYRESRE